MESENSGSDTTINTAYDITGEAQLNGDCVYEADEIELIERRRIDEYKDQCGSWSRLPNTNATYY